MKTITNSDNIIDTRDLQAFVESECETLQALLSDLETALDDSTEEPTDAGDALRMEKRESLADWLGIITGELPEELPASDGDPEDLLPLVKLGTSDDARDLAKLIEFAIDAADACVDYRHGEALIRDGYFEEYAQELAEDIGTVDRRRSWPVNCIDWSAAADALKADYSCVAWAGEDYWIRA